MFNPSRGLDGIYKGRFACKGLMTSVVPHVLWRQWGVRSAKPPVFSRQYRLNRNDADSRSFVQISVRLFDVKMGTQPMQHLVRRKVDWPQRRPDVHPILHVGSNSPYDVPASVSGWIAETNKDEVIVTCRTLVHHPPNLIQPLGEAEIVNPKAAHPSVVRLDCGNVTWG
ncbi:hypothetical protein MCOR16_004299 [Pyricularia oryzae]|nr:hypothetical protein MCOR16_004299 [Pyricularia oryzae]